MVFRKELSTTVISLGACLFALPTFAFAVTDVSMQNLAGNFENSSATRQGKGGFKKADLNGLFAGDPWSLLDGTNKPSNAFLDVSFLFTADTRQKSGDWELSWSGSQLPLTMDFVLLMKGGKQWGAYLFENVSTAAGALDGQFVMPSITKKGRTSKLRYASIFGRLAEIPGDPASIPPVPATIPPPPANTLPAPAYNPPVQIGIPTVADSNSIPVPGSLALLAMGLGLGLRQLRREN